MRWMQQSFGSAIGFVVAAAITTVACGDVVSVSPYLVTVTKNNAPLKCRDGDPYYAVTLLKEGTVLRADARGDGWLRVEYPEGTRGVVKADDVQVVKDGGYVTLTKESRLRAEEQGSNPQHWWFLLDRPLAEGTTLEVIKPIRSPGGTVEGYFIVPPAQARGYVREELVRDATGDEAERFHAKQAQLAEARQQAQADRLAANEPQTRSEPTSDTNTESNDETVAQNEETSTPGAQQADGETQIAANDDHPIDTPEATPAKPAAPVEPVIATLDTLEAKFREVQETPLREAELGAVIAEFDRAINALPDSEENASLRAFYTQRRELLDLRRELQVSILEAEQLSAQREAEARELAQAVDRVQSETPFEVVGRLMPSSVYDGKKLPLMYRLESVDTGPVRTIAYVKPGQVENVEQSVGQVVGIMGSTIMDAQLGLTVVNAQRLESIPLTGEPGTAITTEDPASTENPGQ